VESALLAEACKALPLFPLPGTVLMPGSLLPLHVFEPRYRRLVADCLREHLPLCVPQLRSDAALDGRGRPAYYPYAAVGVIGAHQTLDDGRYNVLVQPVARVLIEDEGPSERLYRVGHARVLRDAPCDPAELRAVGERVRTLFSPVVGRMGEAGSGVARALAALPADRVAEAVASVVLRDDDARQAFIAEDDPAVRARMVEAAVLTTIAGAREPAEA
jgi:Lon protease-like protein